MIQFSPHIAIGVRDFENAVEFYTKVMGFSVGKQNQAESELHLGDITFHIENDGGEHHTWLEFKVDDIESMKKQLESAGCVLQRTHLQKSYLVTDPYGMRFHIWEETVTE